MIIDILIKNIDLCVCHSWTKKNKQKKPISSMIIDILIKNIDLCVCHSWTKKKKKKKNHYNLKGYALPLILGSNTLDTPAKHCLVEIGLILHEMLAHSIYCRPRSHTCCKTFINCLPHDHPPSPTLPLSTKMCEGHCLQQTKQIRDILDWNQDLVI